LALLVNIRGTNVHALYFFSQGFLRSFHGDLYSNNNFCKTRGWRPFSSALHFIGISTYISIYDEITKGNGMSDEYIERMNRIGMALSDSNRVRALMAVRNGEVCVCQLIELLQLAPSTVSKHMSILKHAGLVSSRKDSRWVHYRINRINTSDPASEFISLVVEYLQQDSTVKSDDRAMKKIMKRNKETWCHTVTNRRAK
jgi:DNA-binding transcriptional ArsR family regulator